MSIAFRIRLRPGQVTFGRDGERDGRTNPIEDGVADFLLFLTTELLGRVTVLGVCGKASTLAHADSASLDAESATEMEVPVALDDVDPGGALGHAPPILASACILVAVSAFTSASRSLRYSSSSHRGLRPMW
jgi:hypothetical protein